jgi:putative SOS response-associated peptidase YedK
MIITQPNDFVAEVHDRMPALLMPEQFDAWLHSEMGTDQLKAAPNDYLQRWPVSKRVNSSKADKDDSTLADATELAKSAACRCIATDTGGGVNGGS